MEYIIKSLHFLMSRPTSFLPYSFHFHFKKKSNAEEFSKNGK